MNLKKAAKILSVKKSVMEEKIKKIKISPKATQRKSPINESVQRRRIGAIRQLKTYKIKNR